MEKLVAKNKKAYFDYEILETCEAGIILSGAEVKSIKRGSADMKGSFIFIQNQRPLIENLHISPYQPGNQPNYDPKKTRGLLLKRREIDHLIGLSHRTGCTLIPLQILLKNNLIKILIGVCRGRKKYDKRELIKRRDEKRRIRKFINL